MKLINCLLTPTDLFVKSTNNHDPHFAILGTCMADQFVNYAAIKSIKIDHYLMETWTNAPVPHIETNDKDGIIIHITLRHLLDIATGIGSGDVSYINLPIDQLKGLTIEVLRQRIEQITQALKGTCPLFFLSFIEPPHTTKGFFYNNRANSIYRLIRDLNDDMAVYLQSIQNSYYVEMNDIFSYYGSSKNSDSYHNHFTHAGVFGPQSDDFYFAVIQRIYNATETIKSSNPIKLIITDLDNTLWKGIPAEEDSIIRSAHIEGWPIGYVEALLECKRRGIALAISSKNDEIKTLENLRYLYIGKLSPEDFVSIKINWESKSKNIETIMHECNFLPANVLFIDDNPLEIEEVTRSFPDIRTLTLPQQHWRNVLLHSPQTQTTNISKESENRTELLKAKIARDKMALNQDRETFLQSLNLHVQIYLIRNENHSYFSRAFELLNKTNQFNTTGKRWNNSEISGLLQGSGIIFIANVSDRLADHGLTSLAIVSANTLHQFVLSCRVFGLGVETALLTYILDTQKLAGNAKTTALTKDSGRNASSRDFYSRHGFNLQETTLDGTQLWSSEMPLLAPSWISVEVCE